MDFMSWQDDIEHTNDPVLDREIVTLLGWRIVNLPEPEVIEADVLGEMRRTLLTAYMVDETGERVSDNWHDERSVIEHAWIPSISSDLREIERIVPRLKAKKFTLEYYSGWWVATIISHNGRQWLQSHELPTMAAAIVIRDFLRHEAEAA